MKITTFIRNSKNAYEASNVLHFFTLKLRSSKTVDILPHIQINASLL